MSSPQSPPGWFARFEHAVELYCPDPLVFAVFLTLLLLLMVAVLTDTSAGAAIAGWGNGLHALLAFMTQMTLVIITAHVLAHTRAVARLLKALARIPNSPLQAYSFVTLTAAAFSLVCWPLGPIAGGLIAREVALRAREENMAVHYPLLAAAAFGGFVVWQMGYSSTIALAVATPGNPLESTLGGTIPVAETLLNPWSLLTIITTLTVVIGTVLLLRPATPRGIEVDPDVVAVNAQEEVGGRAGLMGTLEDGRGVSVVLAALLFSYLAHWFMTRGFDLSLNVVNWSFLALGLLLANSIRHYSQLFSDGARAGSAVLLQYPLYGGIMGLMLSSGLTEQFSDLIIGLASERSLALYGFFSAGMINLFIPSGGAQWAIQGPIFIDAAQQLNVDARVVTMSIAWGDQWTNLVQPFCSIPLLIVTGLKLRELYGYLVILCLATALPFALGLYLAQSMAA
jgi:short-chain fatty acids transporter